MKCLVFDCENHSHQGTFIGALCAPCYTLISTGKANYGRDFITKAIKERDAAYRLIGKMVCGAL